MVFNENSFEKPLDEVDPQVAQVIEHESKRQYEKIILIPSESLCPRPVLQALGSDFNNIYAEGYPPSSMSGEDLRRICNYDFQLPRYRRYSDRRFYKGCEYANVVESLARRRAAELFATRKNPPENIYVNVQPLSGAAANNAVYDTFVEPGDVVMGMSLMHGGHLTHGSEFNRSGKNFKIVSYEVDKDSERLDYDKIAELAREHHPKMIIAGYTSYPWAPDFKKFRKIADAVGAVLFADISHPAGMVVAGVYPNPVDYADVVTFTTHKTLCGPRGAVIMTANSEYATRIEQSVFPGEQGGPHVNKFAAMAVAFNIAMSREFNKLQRTILENTKYLGEVFLNNGLRLAYGGTDTHLLLINLNSIEAETGFPLKGETAVRILDLAGIVANKNTIPGDTLTAEASGIRMGTPWISQRGITKVQLEELGNIITRVLKNIHPFTYKGLTGDLPRGKIDLKILEDSAKRVAALAGELMPERKRMRFGYPHRSYGVQTAKKEKPDFLGKDIVLICGQRGLQFIEEVTTCSVNSLEPMRLRRSFLLNRRGRLIAPILLCRLPSDESYGHRFVVLCLPEDTENILKWFRGLSDGYIHFDNRDVFRKIEGPVTVLTLGEISHSKRIEIMQLLEKIENKILQLPDVKDEMDFSALVESFADCFSHTKPYCIGCEAGKPGLGERQREKKIFSHSEPNHAVKKSCLYDEHKKRTKNIIEFAGWEMPIRYSGIIDEHRTVRNACGLFDIAHMGVLEVSGQYSTQFIDIVSSNYVSWIDENESQYSYLLDPQGAVIDDIMIYKFSHERYIIVVNAINNDKDIAWLQAVNSREYSIEKADPEKEVQGRVSIKDLKDPSLGRDCKVNIALQGPRSLDLLKEIASNERKKYNLERLEKAHFLQTELGGIGLIVSRTGYTGEEVGYELFVHPENAPQVWNLLLEKGKKFGLVPVGLGARDSLRIEAGLPLYGHELAGVYNISPLEAGFGAYVKFHKPFFIGRTALLDRMRESRYEVVRFMKEGRGMKMSKGGDPVVSKRTQKIIGWVTSCAVNGDGLQVGMAYVDKKSAREGSRIGIFSAEGVSKKESVEKGDLYVGDRVSLHDEAVILSRFLEESD